MSEQIAEVCWDRGYLYHVGLMIPGGAAGVVQGPDTDLHAWMESQLIEMQDMMCHEKLEVRPHKTPSESKQDMVDYATSLWLAADHTQGEKSFKRNGLNNAMDGSEDHLITRQGRQRNFGWSSEWIVFASTSRQRWKRFWKIELR